MSFLDSLGVPPDISQKAQTIGNNIAAGAATLADDVKSSIGKILDPGRVSGSILDLVKNGKIPGAGSTAGPAKARFASDGTDWRVKISLAKSAKYFYNSTTPGILSPLAATGGVIFPFTPQISVTHNARYGSQQLTHSNYTNYAYEGSEVSAISITGDFTAQNAQEAAYVLACIYFFRSATKMWFGQGDNIGNPPPILFLNGYGANYFPNVPCVLTSFQHTMPQDVDYIMAGTGTGDNPAPLIGTTGEGGTTAASAGGKQNKTMIPTMSQIQITLQPIYSRKNIYDNFSLTDFSKGALLGDGKTGGFI